MMLPFCDHGSQTLGLSVIIHQCIYIYINIIIYIVIYLYIIIILYYWLTYINIIQYGYENIYIMFK